MRNSILMRFLMIFGMMLVQVVQVSAQETAGAPAKVATTSDPVITVSATVVEPGKLCLAMWTLSKLKEPYKITANSFLAYDVQVAKESIGQRGGIDFDGGDASSMRDLPAQLFIYERECALLRRVSVSSRDQRCSGRRFGLS